jgi:hypothetical protein
LHDREGGAINASGPLVNMAIRRFGAKLGLALHRHQTGRTVPIKGAASVQWFTNYNLATGTFPSEVYDLLGPPDTLRQGLKEVSNQFSYASAVPSDSLATSAHLATFRMSFAILVYVAEDAEHIRKFPSDDVLKPGFLRLPRAMPNQMRIGHRWIE